MPWCVLRPEMWKCLKSDRCHWGKPWGSSVRSYNVQLLPYSGFWLRTKILSAVFWTHLWEERKHLWNSGVTFPQAPCVASLLGYLHSPGSQIKDSIMSLLTQVACIGWWSICSYVTSSDTCEYVCMYVHKYSYCEPEPLPDCNVHLDLNIAIAMSWFPTALQFELYTLCPGMQTLLQWLSSVLLFNIIVLGVCAFP